MTNVKKVIVLGSGALKIGEAGEFDYSGSQALKALKEEGIKTILVNPNIATIQTSQSLSDSIYFLPVTPYFVEKIIEKEKPDGILLSFGGQTALNCGIALHKSGVLKKHSVVILGSPISAVILTEDRDKFAKHLHKIGVPTPRSRVATSPKQALKIAQELNFPVMIRAGFALGGQGSGIAKNSQELEKIAEKAFAFVKQILVEQYLHHFKEIEYEVVRDKDDNCVTVCNMENMDPLGIHTGESIVVAPSQTLTNFEYHALRVAAIKIVRSLKIVGECNVQFALNPNPTTRGVAQVEGSRQRADVRTPPQAGETRRALTGGKLGQDPEQKIDYYVIEVNARLSRSSALASKATGYPLAYVAAKLGLGKNLTQITNKVTGVTKASFEPALDYIVVKIPRWDIEKFKGADETIGSSMKSVGEVMGIGRTFEEAYQKAIRMLDLDFEGATSEVLLKKETSLEDSLKYPTPKRMFALARAIKEGTGLEKIHTLTGIDKWFLARIENIVRAEKQTPTNIKELTREHLRYLKRLGVSDRRIGKFVGKKGLDIRNLRKQFGIIPAIFQIDTLGGEFPAVTNYLYLTYNGSHNDVAPSKEKGVIVLGSGPYRIGSSVEFDWTSVETVKRLATHKKEAIIINCNPETVSTDYDISDRLYFEELTFERIADIYDFEHPYGVVVSVGGQTPNNRAQSLKKYGAHVLGTDPTDIDRAEDRSKFSKLLDDIGVEQPSWKKLTTLNDAIAFCKRVGFPVLIRPSFVLSGTLMRICKNRAELTHFLKDATEVSSDYPITVSKFIEEAKELELDAVAQDGNILASIISEHVENAGVHSGDATICLPTQNVNQKTKEKINTVAKKLAKALRISGPCNIQFLAKDDSVSVIEINLRSSRTFPFISKVTGTNFIALAVDAFFGKGKAQQIRQPDFVAVKVAQFSFARLSGADPILRVEMQSTGEVACFGNTIEEAFLKGELAVGTQLSKKGLFVSVGGEENKRKFLNVVAFIKNLDIPVYATEKTQILLKKYGIQSLPVYKVYEGKSPNPIDIIIKGKIDVAINIPEIGDLVDDYRIRRSAIDHNISLFTDLKKASLYIKAVATYELDDLEIKDWNQYQKKSLKNHFLP